jgi:hypothetical protein
MTRRRGPGATLAALLPLLLAGCVWMRSYPDPAAPMVGYRDLARTGDPLKLRVTVEFERNGERLARGDRPLQYKVERVLHASGVIEPTPGSTAGELHVVLDNLTDPNEEAATIGKDGGTIRDTYVMSVTISAGGRTFSRDGLRDSVLTAVGGARAPAGIQPVTATTAFDRMIERMIIGALLQFQRDGASS